ncbi:hypothetical protein BC938DRAFT_481165 [Jimgerdemannia flammicorona]|uniref:Uncharacterized protein n=1 Tax=Jimgerdemannia flammicorona TaxID=994334 RepID=A0A433QGT8_9FUNG|nr:hypothetical protein BC938DRAFT_481165 [Jimgerdemannia flammicorona]
MKDLGGSMCWFGPNDPILFVCNFVPSVSYQMKVQSFCQFSARENGGGSKCTLQQHGKSGEMDYVGRAACNRRACQYFICPLPR